MSHQAVSLLRYAALFVLFLPAFALKRTLGPANDARFLNASSQCNASFPASFEFDVCSDAITCMYAHLGEALKASMACGTSIVALLPTILAIIGSSPQELVQLALVSPHRALATCCFSIGLPNNLFRQLRPLDSQPQLGNALPPKFREWKVRLPAPGSMKWLNIIGKLAVDVVILTLAGITLWRNWLISSFTMIPWRCEYSYLLLAWPIACAIWLIIAVILLFVMTKSAVFYYPCKPRCKPLCKPGYNPPCKQLLKYNLFHLMLLQYRFGHKEPQPESAPQPLLDIEPKDTESKDTAISMAEITGSGSNAGHGGHGGHEGHCTAPLEPTATHKDDDDDENDEDDKDVYEEHFITVRIGMHTNSGLWSWRCYDTIVECLAVGIYLYATFVLTSTLFLNADKAIWFVTVMSACLSGINVLSTLF